MTERTLLIVLVTLVLLIVPVLTFTVHRLMRVKRELVQMRQALERSDRDLTGLCSAAVQLENRLFSGNQTLLRLAGQVAELERAEQQEKLYREAVEKVRAGAGIDELVQSCGISRDEAALLSLLQRHADSP